MKTLGIVILVLLAMFFGTCAATAWIFTYMDSTLFVVGLIAAGLCAACIAGIRGLNRKPQAAPPPVDDDPPQ